MNKVTEQNATETLSDQWSTEASTLELRPGVWPGVWPDRLETTLGNGQDFVMEDLSLMGGSYKQENGILELVVFND